MAVGEGVTWVWSSGLFVRVALAGFAFVALAVSVSVLPVSTSRNAVVESPSSEALLDDEVPPPPLPSVVAWTMLLRCCWDVDKASSVTCCSRGLKDVRQSRDQCELGR